MTEFKADQYLAMLLEKAQTHGDPNKPLTAERFLMAVLKEIRLPSEKGENLVALINILNDYRLVQSIMLQRLAEYVAYGRGNAVVDSLYMQRRMKVAQTKATENHATEVSASLLLSLILAEPNTTIQGIITEAKEVAAKKEQESDSDSSAEAVADTGELDLEDLFEPIEGAEDAPLADTVKSQISELVQEVKKIRKALQNTVFGQDKAINTFISGYFKACLDAILGVRSKRPRGTFLFAGPPGVGKTFLAENIAKELGLPFKRFDMSEYADKEANLEFCGSDKVYKNGKSGNVTSFVADNPKCVLLFDEIEKAHLTVIHLFLQMLDAGRLRDNYTDAEVSFLDAIIILTTNAGKQLYEESESGDFSTVSRKVIINALQTDVHPETKTPFFPAAICSRLAAGNVVMLNHIRAHNLRDIAVKEIESHTEHLQEESGIQVTVDDRIYTALLFSEGSAVDARTIRGRAETFFNDEVYELMRLVSAEKVKTGISDIEELRWRVDLDGAPTDIAALFELQDKAQALVFADDSVVEFCRKKAKSCHFFGAQTVEEALNIAEDQDIGFILLDMHYGAAEVAQGNLNAADLVSPAREFFRLLREKNSSIPVYLLERSADALSEEEVVSFLQQGIRDVLVLEKGKGVFAERIDRIAVQLHQQACMNKLARERKVVSFETAQTLSEDGKTAEICLFDFKMRIAVDAEDSKNILNAVSRPDVRFDDVIGANDAKQELAYFVEYLRNPKKYKGTGVKAPKGVLLYGPPGTGKTMLAKAMAGEADITFIAAEGNQFIQQRVGEGPKKVHDLFRVARKYAPSILFIDEIDAIAKERTGSGMNEETLTAFLTEMDGFVSNPSKPVFVLAATNFDVEPGGKKSLDPALMRRFDRRILIDLPDKEDRTRFLRKKIAGNPALQVSEEKLDNLIMRSTGMSLAELDSIIELALRSAIRASSTVVTDAILEEAFETFSHGETKQWSESLLERVARHESGHAFLCWLSGETPSYLTIVARGDHGGYMRHADDEGKVLYTKEELLAKIRTALGGRAAELVYYGARDGISTGASGDLLNATRNAQRMVCSYGMEDDFGLSVVYADAAYNGAMTEQVREQVNRILQEQMAEAVRLISENKDKIDSLVAELMVKNHLNGAEIVCAITKGAADPEKVTGGE